MKRTKKANTFTGLFDDADADSGTVVKIKTRSKKSRRTASDSYAVSQAYQQTQQFRQQLQQQYQQRNTYGRFHVDQLSDNNLQAFVDQIENYPNDKVRIRVFEQRPNVLFVPTLHPAYILLCLICTPTDQAVFTDTNYLATVNIMDLHRFN